MKKRFILLFMVLLLTAMLFSVNVNAATENTEFVQSTLSQDNSVLKLYFKGQIDEEDTTVLVGNDTLHSDIVKNVPVKTVLLIENTDRIPDNMKENLSGVFRDYLSEISDNESIAVVKFDKKLEQMTDGYIKNKYDIDTALSKIKFDETESNIYDSIVETTHTLYDNSDTYCKIIMLTSGFEYSRNTSFENLKNEIDKKTHYHIDVIQATTYSEPSKQLKDIATLSTNTYTFYKEPEDITKLAENNMSLVKVYLKETITTGEYKGVMLKSKNDDITIGSVLFPQADWSKGDLEAQLNDKTPSLLDNIPLLIGIGVGGVLLIGGGITAFVLIRKKKKIKQFDITVFISKDSERDNNGTGQCEWRVTENQSFKVGRVKKPFDGEIPLPENDFAICENANEESQFSIGRNAFEIFYSKENHSLIVRNIAKSAVFYVDDESNEIQPNATFELKQGMKILLGLYTTVKVINIEQTNNKKKK